MSDPNRRTMLRMLGAAPVAAGFVWTEAEAQQAHEKAHAAKQAAATAPASPFKPAFFNGFRDLTASGFWTTRMGMDDLQYMGNRYVAAWTGCPAEVLAKLGVQRDG